MQHVIAKRTRRTFLWCLIADVIRTTPGHTKSAMCVVTMTLLSPAINSRCTIPRSTIIWWNSSYLLDFWLSAFFAARQRDKEAGGIRESTDASFYWLSSEFYDGSFRADFCCIRKRNYYFSSDLTSRIFAMSTAHWYLKFVRCRYKRTLF